MGGTFFNEPPIWRFLCLEGPYGHDSLLPVKFSSSDQVPVLVNFMKTYFLSHCLHKLYPVRLTGGLFEGEGIISYLYVGGQGFVKLGRLSV